MPALNKSNTSKINNALDDLHITKTLREDIINRFGKDNILNQCASLDSHNALKKLVEPDSGMRDFEIYIKHKMYVWIAVKAKLSNGGFASESIVGHVFKNILCDNAFCMDDIAESIYNPEKMIESNEALMLSVASFLGEEVCLYITSGIKKKLGDNNLLSNLKDFGSDGNKLPTIKSGIADVFVKQTTEDDLTNNSNYIDLDGVKNRKPVSGTIDLNNFNDIYTLFINNKKELMNGIDPDGEVLLYRAYKIVGMDRFTHDDIAKVIYGDNDINCSDDEQLIITKLVKKLEEDVLYDINRYRKVTYVKNEIIDGINSD